MSIYNAYVKTAHGVKIYQVAAVSEDAAKREAQEYGRVTLLVKVCRCAGH